MAATRVHINPEILTWAVKRVGKDVDEYAQKDSNFQRMSSNISNAFFIKFDGEAQAQKLSTILRWAATSTTYNERAKQNS